MEVARSNGGDPRRVEVLNIALKELGKKYEWGGNGPDAWDCSGLVKHSFEGVGVKLPRVTYDQVKEGREVPRGKYEAGDLLFFNHNGHVGIYIGNGLMIHALGDRVKVESFSKSISAARRVLLRPVGSN
ncbi:MAG: C40 family peptidase [Candidatus Geothermincolia bacterium]